MNQPDEDVVMIALKARYFDLLRKEDIPNTPKVTLEADRLEQAIKELKQKKGQQ